MRQKKLMKKAGSLLLAAAMIIPSVPGAGREAYAAEVSAAEASAGVETEEPIFFADVDKLKSYTTEENYTKGYICFGKNYRGKDMHWFIAGCQDPAVDSVTLIASGVQFPEAVTYAEEGGDKEYNTDWKCTYPAGDPESVHVSHYGASIPREKLQELATSTEYFSETEQQLMKKTTIYTYDTKNNSVYSTTDTLYLPYAGSRNDSYITVGANGDTEDTLNNGLKVYNYYYSARNNTVSSCWLRTPTLQNNGQSSYKVLVTSIATNARDLREGHVYSQTDYYNPSDMAPAFELDVSDVLFASAAGVEYGTSRKTGQLAEKGNGFYYWHPMKLKLKSENPTEEIGTLEYDAATGEIKAAKASGADNATLVVQGKVEGENTDWYYNVPVDGEMSVTKKDLQKEDDIPDKIRFSKCKIWLETTRDNVTYATMLNLEDIIEEEQLDEGAEVTLGDGTVITLPQGGTRELPDRTITAREIRVGETTITAKEDAAVSVITASDDGTITVPAEGVVKTGSGPELAIPYGRSAGTVDKDGTLKAKCIEVGACKYPDDGGVKAWVPDSGGGYILADKEGNIAVPIGGYVQVYDGDTSYDRLDYGGRVDKDGNITENKRRMHFAAKEELKDFDTNDEDDIGRNIARLVLGKNGFGWWITGSQDSDSVTLFVDTDIDYGSEYMSERNFANSNDGQAYSQDWKCNYGEAQDPESVYANHYGASSIRDTIQIRDAESSDDAQKLDFSEDEKSLLTTSKIYTKDTKNNSVYSTEDILYLPHGEKDEKYITVGENAPDDLNKGLRVDHYYWNRFKGTSLYPYYSSASICLRTPDESAGDKALVANYSSSHKVGTREVYYPSSPIERRAALKLDLTKVLFASEAGLRYDNNEGSGQDTGYGVCAKESASSSIYQNEEYDQAMRLRLDGSEQDIGTVTYHDRKGEITVSRGSCEQDVYLVVQMLLGDGPSKKDQEGWYYKKIEGEEVVTKQDISDVLGSSYMSLLNPDNIKFEDCKIWLETKTDTDRVLYAVLAESSSRNVTLAPGETDAGEDETITNGTDGKVVIDAGSDGTEDVTITLPSPSDITINEDRSVTVPGGGRIQIGDITITVPEGGSAEVDKDGKITVPGGGRIQIGDITITVPEGESVTVDKDGRITVPAGGSVKIGDGAEIALPDGGTVDKDGKITVSAGGKVTIGDTTVTVPGGGSITADKDGKITVPAGGEVQTGEGEKLTLPNGGTVDKDGTITVPAGGKVAIGDGPELILPNGGTADKDGTVEADQIVNGSTTVTAPSEGENVTADKDGKITVPAGGSVETKDGVEMVLPNGGTVDKDGTVEADQIIRGDATVTAPSEDENVTADKDGQITVPAGGSVKIGNGAELVLPDGGTVDKDGKITVSAGGKITIGDTTVTVPDGGSITADKDGKITVPAGGEVQTGEGEKLTLPNGGTVDKDGKAEAGQIIRGETTVTAPAEGERVTADKDGNIIVPAGGSVETADGNVVTLPYGGTVDEAGNIIEQSFAGRGTAENPYQIKTEEDLKKLAELVNDGKDQKGAHYIIEAGEGIALTEESRPWTPIGTADHPFTGTFDGDGKTIKGVEISGDEPKDNQGLFGVNAGTIENLTVEGSVTGKDNVGGIAGTNAATGTIQNCTADVTVAGQNDVGGIVGKNDGKVTGGANKGSVTGKDNAGGIAGSNDGVIRDSINYAEVTGENGTGGITGINGGEGTVDNGNNNGNVTTSGEGGNDSTGALVGKNENTDAGSVSGSYKKDDTTNSGLTGIGGKEDTEDIKAVTGDIEDPQKPFEGSGTAENPYKIKTEDDLAKLAELVNGGKDKSGAHYQIGAEDGITLTEKNKPWTPIGTADHPFTGTFDGVGKTIKGLEISDDEPKDNQGLFGVNAGTIENLTVEGSVTGKDNVGGIAGTNTEDGTIKNCTSEVTVTGQNNAGGIVGNNDGTVTDCTNKGSVTGQNNVGGIAGTNGTEGILTDNVDNGNVTGGTTSTTGAVIGKNDNPDPNDLSGNYYQKTEGINEGITGIGGKPQDPAGITSGSTPTPEGNTPTPTPGGNTPTPTPGGNTPTPTPGGTIPTQTPGDDMSGLTPEQQKEVDQIAKELNVPVETAKKLQKMAQELGIETDLLLLTDNDIVNQKSEGDVKGSSFSKLQAKASKAKKNSITVKWNKVRGADGYQIYTARCGKNNKYSLAKTINKAGTTRFTYKKLKKKTAYKIIVKAYKVIDGKKYTVAASKTVHEVTTGGKRTNAKSVKVNKRKVKIKRGKKFKIKARIVKASPGKKLANHRKISYESANSKIATVSRKGVIRGKKKGTCYVYIYAENGIFKKVKVTVK